jgi:hypothetical protein
MLRNEAFPTQTGTGFHDLFFVYFNPVAFGASITTIGHHRPPSVTTHHTILSLTFTALGNVNKFVSIR